MGGGGIFWSVYKPGSCVDTISRKPGDEWPIFRKENYPDKVCMFDLNGNCDLGATVWKISDIVYGDANDPECKLPERERYYEYYKGIIK